MAEGSWPRALEPRRPPLARSDEPEPCALSHEQFVVDQLIELRSPLIHIYLITQGFAAPKRTGLGSGSAESLVCDGWATFVLLLGFLAHRCQDYCGPFGLTGSKRRPDRTRRAQKACARVSKNG